MARGVPFVKGHGTENDFVLLPDPDGTLYPDLDAGAVQRLTDRYTAWCRRRHPCGAKPRPVAGREIAADAEWFMDYRNADGSADVRQRRG